MLLLAAAAPNAPLWTRWTQRLWASLASSLPALLQSPPPPANVPYPEFAALPAPQQRRLAVLNRVEYKQRAGGDETAAAQHIRTRIEETIELFRTEVREKGGRESLLAAEMEHNRWMGERLAKGWRFGPRDPIRQQRVTFIPWTDDLRTEGPRNRLSLTDTETRYDRKDLPQLILKQQEQGAYAYIESSSVSAPSPTGRSPSPCAPPSGTAAGTGGTRSRRRHQADRRRDPEKQ